MLARGNLSREAAAFPGDEEEEETITASSTGEDIEEEGMHTVEDEGEAVDFSDEADAEEEEDEDEA